MLQAFDENKDKKLLHCVMEITEWLHYKDLLSSVYLLNWYQTIFRANSNDERIDNVKLKELMDSNEDDSIKAGAAIVLGEKEHAKEIIARLGKVDQEMFMSLPISNLL